MQELSLQRRTVNDWMQAHGARFSVLRRGRRQYAAAPYDPIPRVLAANEFTALEQGLIQRINALNLFLRDIYHDRMILKDGVIPEEFVFSSPDFRPQCMGVVPIAEIYAHITATDLLRTASGQWYAIEDNLSLPDGISFSHLARKLCREAVPEQYDVPTLCDNCGLDILLKQLYNDIQENMGELASGIVVYLSQGDDADNAFELKYLAELTGSVVAKAENLIVMDNTVYYRAPEGGGFQKVSILHRLCADSGLDPLCFDADTLWGVPHLMEVYAAGRIAILNAPGCSIGEDRGLFYFIPEMIRYYLGEEPLLPNAPTYLPWNTEQREYMFNHMSSLVFKDVGSDMRTGSVRGSDLTPEQQEELKAKIIDSPRRYVAQEVLEVECLPVVDDRGLEQTARCDLRAYTVHSDSIRVWMGGLSRFTIHYADGSAEVGFKDTWVMSE